MKRVALTLAAVAVAGLSWSAPAMANDNVCPELDSGKVDVSGEVHEITVTAPEGQLIGVYCVKAGSAKQGDGPVTVAIDPGVTELTITHPSGKAISHYSLGYTDPEPEPEPAWHFTSKCVADTGTIQAIVWNDGETVLDVTLEADTFATLQSVALDPGFTVGTTGATYATFTVNGGDPVTFTAEAEGCTSTTTTTSTPTTTQPTGTTTTSTSTSTTSSTVAPTTSTTESPVPSTETPAPTPTTDPPDPCVEEGACLPMTGADLGLIAAVGAALLALGGLTLRAERRFK